jgi:hypothetical protein
MTDLNEKIQLQEGLKAGLVVATAVTFKTVARALAASFVSWPPITSYLVMPAYVRIAWAH